MSYRDYSCRDCRESKPWGFMVHDTLWASAGLQPKDILCQSCFEKRIGRPLVAEDLTLCGLNFMNLPELVGTEENYRKWYAEGGMDYDSEKAAYFERCRQLGTEPNWITF